MKTQNKYLGSAQKLVQILFTKCPVSLGLLQTDYVKLFFNKPRFNYIVTTCFLMLFFFNACTQMPAKQPKPSEKEPQTQIPVEPTEPEQKIEIGTEIPIVEILIKEAETLNSQGDKKDALFIYNQAYSLGSEEQKQNILSSIENVLANTSSQDIIEFSSIENLQIPQPLLIYWLGINHVLENNLIEAKKIFEQYLMLYPDHSYYVDATQLIDMIKKSLFKRDSIGLLLPLTGKYKVFGQRALNGIQLAIQELSDRYDHEFKVIIKDTKADPIITQNAVRQLHQENVAAIVGPLLKVTEAGLVAQELQMPLIALTQKSDFPLQGDYLFSNFITPEMQVQTLGAYLFQELNIKKIAILYPNEKYGQKYMELFWDIVDEYEIDVVGVEAYDGKNTDFTEPIQKLTGEFFPVPEFLKSEIFDPYRFIDPKIINLDPVRHYKYQEIETKNRRSQKEKKDIEIDFDALFIPDSPSKINLILPQLAFHDARGMYIIGTNLWHNERILKESRRYNSKAVITDGFFADSQNPKTAEFTQKYQVVYGEKPKFLEAISYDTAFFLFKTVLDPSIESRHELVQALKGQRIYDGVTGTTMFDENGRARRELFLMTIKKNKFVEIYRK